MRREIDAELERKYEEYQSLLRQADNARDRGHRELTTILSDVSAGRKPQAALDRAQAELWWAQKGVRERRHDLLEIRRVTNLPRNRYRQKANVAGKMGVFHNAMGRWREAAAGFERSRKVREQLEKDRRRIEGCLAERGEVPGGTVEAPRSDDAVTRATMVLRCPRVVEDEEVWPAVEMPMPFVIERHAGRTLRFSPDVEAGIPAFSALEQEDRDDRFICYLMIWRALPLMQTTLDLGGRFAVSGAEEGQEDRLVLRGRLGEHADRPGVFSGSGTGEYATEFFTCAIDWATAP